MESHSRKHFGCVRQENACLNMQDDDLISNLDAMQYELASSNLQVRPRGTSIGVKNGVAIMSQQIRQLQANLESRATELKAAELRADCIQEAAAHSDILVATLTGELSSLREELEDTTALGKRAEQQRNQALQNAETLKEAFRGYKSTLSNKLKRVKESESKLKESLVECDREKEEWEMKCTVLEKGNVEHSQTISQLKEEGRQVKSAAAGLQAQLEDAGQKISHLERQLKERGAETRELASLRKELENLHTVTRSQEQRVAQSHREAQRSQAELASLDAILSLLHLREGAVGTLCIRPCMFPPVNYEGTAHLLKLKPGEGYQQLLRAMQTMETERSAQNNVCERLQERLSRAQEEISSLQSSMTQRATHYQSLHTELQDKVSQATDTEKELKRKSARMASMEKQLQEKTSAYNQAALTNTELERQLMEKTSNLQHYQSQMTKKQREYQQSLDKCKQSQSQQLTEQQHRMEMKAQSQMSLMEQELSSLQRERDEAQGVVLVLQGSVDQLTQQRQVEVRHNEELLQSFTEQAAQSSAAMCELQSSLSTCREELNSYLQQMEKMKKNYESELQKNKNRVSSLQEKLHDASMVCHSSSEENLQLQLSLQRQQTMLTESTAHISELEESQNQLQKQVSSLEQQMARARATLHGEARSRERDTQERDKDLQEMKQHNVQLSESVGHLTSEMAKCRGELASKDSELQHLRKDVNEKILQVSCMDETLQQTKKKLDSRNDMAMDLEEKLHRCEADRLNCVHRARLMEGQLLAAQRELAETLEQLRELRDVLKSTQTIADERQASVEQLTIELSETHIELEERTHEILDMDIALKKRQGELQQRAQLLDQLEVAIKEHKQEMQKKVESLQQSLQARERDLRDTQKEHTDRNMDVRLAGVKEELALKEACWLQLEAELQSMVASLELELDLEKQQHSKELESLQQTHGQLLNVSEEISSTMMSSQQHLVAQLQQSQLQLEEAKLELDQAKTQLERNRNQLSHLQTRREQTQTQLLQSKTELEQSRILQEQTTAQNNLLHAQLEQLGTQLNQAEVQVARLQAELQTSKKSMETSIESLLIKESEATRLQARISCLGRAADHKRLYSHTLSHSSGSSSSSHFPSTSTEKAQTALPSSKPGHSTRLISPTSTQTCPISPAHEFLQPASSPRTSDQTESNQVCDWLQRSSLNSSLDLPLSLKATLREAMGIRPWECSSSPSSSLPSSSSSPAVPSFTADHSWQGISHAEAAAICDLSFNPLTYMVDKRDDVDPDTEDSSPQQRDEEQTSESKTESVRALVGQEEEEEDDDDDMRSLTGMLRFVNQTLAMQEDPSLWSPAGPSQTAHILQSDVKET